MPVKRLTILSIVFYTLGLSILSAEGLIEVNHSNFVEMFIRPVVFGASLTFLARIVVRRILKRDPIRNLYVNPLNFIALLVFPTILMIFIFFSVLNSKSYDAVSSLAGLL